MKYYYSRDNQQFGPFTIDELKTKQLKKSTLVWTEGMNDWANANDIEDLDKIFISEPPPLPSQKVQSTSIEAIPISQPKIPSTNTRFDHTYKKETAATIIGIVLLTVPIIITLSGPFHSSYSSYETKNFLSAATLIIRIGVTVLVVNIASRQKRNSTLWGLFAFLLPSFALIIIGQLRKLNLEIEIDENLPQNEQTYPLIDKAKQLYTSNRMSEVIEILNKVIELDSQNFDAILLRAKSYYHIGKYKKAKKDFRVLLKDSQFLGEVNLHLGMIESLHYNYVKAIKFWETADEFKNEDARVFLDRYSTFKGTYTLNKSQYYKKLGSAVTIGETGANLPFLEYLNGLVQVDKITQLNEYKTYIILHEYGFILKLSKLFKSYQFAISYTEINDITIQDSILELVLYDKSILKFHYISKNDIEGRLQNILNNFTEETGIEPRVLENAPHR